MFLSFIIPVFNAEKYIVECLDSLLTQNLPSNDYEVICVNDGSTDSSLSVLERYLYHEKGRVQISLISQKNAGVSAARNAGLSLAKGDYIWFVDADDFIRINILDELKTLSQTDRPDVIQFGAYSFYSFLSDEECEKKEAGLLDPNSFANNVFVTRSIFKRSFLESKRLRFTTGIHYSEDKVFLSEVMAENPNVETIDKAYYFYRYNPESAISTVSPEALNLKMDSWLLAVEKYKSLYEKSSVKNKSAISDNLMADLCSYVFEVAKLPREEARNRLAQLKQHGLFPFKRPSECTLKKSYQTDRSDIVGKAFDFLWIHLNTLWGYYLMYIYCHIKG